MEVVTVLVTALSFVAYHGAEGIVTEAAKDAYRSLKEFLRKNYPKVDLTRLEETPTSDARKAVVAEDLTTSGAVADPAFSPIAKRLIDAVKEAAQKSRSETGIELHEFEAASLLVDDVIASGKGIVVTKSKIAGHAKFRNVRAGVTEGSQPKKG